MEKKKMYTLPELIEKLEPIYSEHRKNIKLGIDGLTLYAAQLAQRESDSPKVEEIKSLEEWMVGYWIYDNEGDIDETLKRYRTGLE